MQEEGSYQGEWNQNKRHGKGQFTFPDGSSYLGDWHEDEMHGYGVFERADGCKFEGRFEAGRLVEGEFTAGQPAEICGQPDMELIQRLWMVPEQEFRMLDPMAGEVLKKKDDGEGNADDPTEKAKQKTKTLDFRQPPCWARTAPKPLPEVTDIDDQNRWIKEVFGPDSVTALQPLDVGASNLVESAARGEEYDPRIGRVPAIRVDLSSRGPAAGIGPHGAATLAAILRRRGVSLRVLQLDLKDSRVGPVGMASLAAALTHLSHLRDLGLRGNRLGVWGGRELGGTFEALRRMERIDLAQNELGEFGAKILVESGLSTLQKLRHLDFGWNSLGQEGTQQLSVALVRLTSLVSLDLGGNGFGEAGAGPVFDVATRITSLRTLTAWHNGLGWDLVQPVREARPDLLLHI